MTDYILVDGDEVNFEAQFGTAIVTVKAGNLSGSGKARVDGKPVCVQDDEKKVSVPGCPYTTSEFTTAGKGTVTISALGTDQLAGKTKVADKSVLLKGTKFKATFEVTQPAMGPGSPQPPDPVKEYSGTGTFKASNTKWTGS